MNKRSLGIVVYVIAMLVVSFSVVYFMILGPQWEQSRLLKNGLPGTAIIKDISSTGVIINDQPRVKLLLEVEPENGSKYETEIRMVISPVYLPQFQSGARLKVKEPVS